jgi:hypothetical protein
MLDCTYNKFGMPLLDIVGVDGMNKTFTIGICSCQQQRYIRNSRKMGGVVERLQFIPKLRRSFVSTWQTSRNTTGTMESRIGHQLMVQRTKLMKRTWKVEPSLIVLVGGLGI